MNFAELRALLERHNLHLARGLGQNFLIDASQAERLAERAGVQPADTVIEIGTGLGALTRALAERARRVVSVEIDAGIVRALREESLLPDGVELVHADALDVDLAEWIAKADGPVRVVANLPYATATPMLRRLLDLRGSLVDWSVMVQRELAVRLVAEVGTRDYGSFTVLHRLCTSVRREMDLGPRSFFPAPRVRSSFLRFEPHDRYRLGEGELACVERVIRAAFNQRRKTLQNALRGGGFEPECVAVALSEAGLDPRARAETVAPEDWLVLSRGLAPLHPIP